MSKPLRLSYSSLSAMSSCARKFQIDKLYRQTKRSRRSYAGDTGTAIHEGFQDFLVNGDEDNAILAMMMSFPFDMQGLQTNDYRDFNACLSTLLALMEYPLLGEYELAHIRRPNTPEEIAAGQTEGVVVPAIEVPFEIRFVGMDTPDGRPITHIGYIDAVLRNYLSGAYRSTDLKTGRLNMRDSTARFKFNSQQIPYGLVIEHIAAEAIESFEVLYLDCYVDLLEPRIQPYAFIKTKQDIQEWCINKVLQIQQLRTYMAADFFPRTESGCVFYQQPCRYLEPCMSRDQRSVEMYLNGGMEFDPNETEEDTFFPWITVDLDLRELIDA